MKNCNSDKSKVEIKKRKKEHEISSAAYELFTTKGTKNTAIDDIVKKAGVAKGTFYLYFKDKYDVINKLTLQKSSVIVKEALDEVAKQQFDNSEDKIIYFINYIIDYLKENKVMLKLINKNLSWGVFRKALMRPEEYSEMQEIVTFFHSEVEARMSKEEAMITLFFIFELIGSVCYSSIILEEPDHIDNIKPILFKKIIALIK